uniref:Uncharacterized protein n=1 Tax=Anguilla anguilla TaxID=7936 RepID=A0A0E9XEP4_ANGAN
MTPFCKRSQSDTITSTQFPSSPQECNAQQRTVLRCPHAKLLFTCPSPHPPFLFYSYCWNTQRLASVF